MRRGGTVVMCFSTSTRAPRKSASKDFAWIPRIVRMQVPTAVAARSEGENASPFPWLSTGASVSKTLPDGPWVARVRRSPRYSQEIFTLIQEA